jgi:two-component system OmpR family response regulator
MSTALNLALPVTSASRARILVVEDDDQIAEAIRAELGQSGFMTAREAAVPDALDRVMATPFDLLILDRKLGASDSLEIVELLRAQDNMVPVLFVSAMNAVDDRIDGLMAGGDDYLVKPFALGELRARVEALLRRPSLSARESILRAGPLVADLIERTVFRDDRSINLLPREFRLLEYLMRRPNQVVTREMLLRDVWRYRFIPKTNLVDVHLGKLRRKIDTPDDLVLLHSVRSLGFILKINA